MTTSFSRISCKNSLDRATSSTVRLPIVVSRFIVRSSRGDRIWPLRFPSSGEPLSEYLFCRHTLKRGEGAFQTSTLFFPKTLFERVPFKIGLRRHQDWDWLLRALELPDVRIEAVDKILSIYHVHDQKESVSRSLDWHLSLEWGRANRSRITSRAYSAFIVGECLPQAVECRSGFRAYALLLYEAVFEGRMTPSNALLYIGYILSNQKMRNCLSFRNLLK